MYKGANKFLFAWALCLTAFILMGVTIPNHFTAGTTISSAQVNANFAALEAAVNALEDPQRSGTMVAHIEVTAAGAVANSWTSTGGAITVTKHGIGDYIVQIDGVALNYGTHLVATNGANIAVDRHTSVASGASVGYGHSLRVRVWDPAGAAVDNIFTIAIFNP